MRRRTTVLVTVASLLLLATTLAAYVRHAVLDAGQFAGRATTALHDPRTRGVAAERVTDDLVLRGAPDLIAARPLIVGAVEGVVGGDAFGALFRRGVTLVLSGQLERCSHVFDPASNVVASERYGVPIPLSQ